MNSKVAITPKLVISVIIFFAVCLFGTVSDINAKTLNAQIVPNDATGLKLIAVENETDHCEFQIYYGSEASAGFVFPHTTFHFGQFKSLSLPTQDQLVIKCCKGSFLPVYVQYGGIASGDIEDGYEGPFFLSMWLQYPQVPETSKVHVRYMVHKDHIGTVGIKIGNKGDYRFVAYEHVKFIA